MGRRRLWRLVLQVVTAVALAIDAYVHADLAANYDAVNATISQGTLFRLEAAAAALAGLLVLLAPRRRAVWAFALVVSASALGAVLLYRYVDVGKLGPLPNMYEPIWFAEKVTATVAEGVATVSSALGLAGLSVVRGRHRRV